MIVNFGSQSGAGGGTISITMVDVSVGDIIIPLLNLAPVAELVDATDSKSVACKGVPVRVGPGAPFADKTKTLVIQVRGNEIGVCFHLRGSGSFRGRAV